MTLLSQLITRHRHDDELYPAIQEQLEEKIAELIDDGMVREETERIARREFGGVALIERRSREVWQWPRSVFAWLPTASFLTTGTPVPCIST
jgi:hypothetical protein